MKAELILLAALVLPATLGAQPGPVEGAAERVPLNTVVPDYPAKARRDRIEGEVEVCFKVDREGHPYRIGVRRSTHRVFERAAIRAIRASRFKALPASVPVPAIKSCRTFTFSLEPAEA